MMINPLLLQILQILTIIFLIILQFLAILFTEAFLYDFKFLKYIRLFLCIILPLILLLAGIFVFYSVRVNILDLPFYWYYVISVIWLGIGIIIYGQKK